MSSAKCEWKADSDGVYQTSCSNAFTFECDGPKDNGFKFCPYCGLRLLEAIQSEDDE